MHFNSPFKRFREIYRVFNLKIVREFIDFAQQQQPAGIQLTQPDNGREFQPAPSRRLAVGWYSNSPPVRGLQKTCNKAPLMRRFLIGLVPEKEEIIMEIKEFKRKVQGYMRAAGIDLPVIVKYESDKGRFAAPLPGIMVYGNPVTGTITVNWGDRHCAVVAK